MSNTKTITVVTSEEVRFSAYRNKSSVIIDNPEIDEMLKEVDWGDIVTHVLSEKVGPDEVFSDAKLSEWAEKNGYIKDDGQIKG